MAQSSVMSNSVDSGMARVEKQLFVNDELGLHARPAAKIAQAAQQFQSSITLKYEDTTVDAKSILDILTLAAGRGACLLLRCEGMDAKNAASELSALFDEVPAVEE